jgi:hypothetical protein
MDKMDHLMAEKNENNKDSQKGQVTPKKYLKKKQKWLKNANLVMFTMVYSKSLGPWIHKTS